MASWKERKFVKNRKRFKPFCKEKEFDRGYEIDGSTYQYLAHVLERMSTDEFASEENDVVINNVFKELKGKERDISCNQLGSRVMERLVQYAGAEVLNHLMEEFGGDLRTLACDRFASHVLQKLLESVSEKAKIVEDCAEFWRKSYKKWLLKVGKFMLNNLLEFVEDSYANHVIRTLLVCLVGETLEMVEKHFKLSKEMENLTSQQSSAKKVSSKCKALVREYAETLMSSPKFPDLPFSTLPSRFLQVVLLVLKKTDQTLADELGNKILDDCALIDRVFHTDDTYYLFCTILAAGSPEVYEKIYISVFKGHLLKMSLHPRKNYAVQKLFALCTDKNQFETMFDEIAENLEEIVLSNNSGVILSLAHACRRLSTKQGNFIKHLMQAFHCQEPADRQKHFTLAVATMKAFEKFSEEDISVNLHGSLLLQTMLMFHRPKTIVDSILEIKPSTLEKLFSDRSGSHIVDKYMESVFVGEKGRDRLIKKLQGSYVHLACSKHGSRSVDAIWNASSLQQKLLIVNELAPQENTLKLSQCGSFISRNYGLSLYKHRKDDWINAIGQKQNKRKMFADIIGDIEKDDAAKKSKAS